MSEREQTTLHILGGGPAGLGAAWFAGARGFRRVLYEASDNVGGNCRTLKLGPFLYDTGAHRLHDKDSRITSMIRDLLGEDLRPVDAPSAILHGDTFIDFPLHLRGLLSGLNRTELSAVAGSFLQGRFLNQGKNDGTGQPPSFGTLARRAYGRHLAEMFLLNYSRKLWGCDPDGLSPAVSGGRLKGLDFGAFLRMTFAGRRERRRNLDGRFYYPRLGIGMIADRIAEELGSETIRYRSRITGLMLQEKRITSLEVNGTERVAIGPNDIVISTLPLTILVRILSPAPPAAILRTAESLRFRHLRLIVVGLTRPSLSANASIYVPDASVPFTRLYESKNRSAAMAPTDSTSIVIELPCSRDDRHATMNDDELRSLATEFLRSAFGISDEEICAFAVRDVPFAYPILELGFEERAATIRDHLLDVENLRLTGRSALFRYTHIHDLLRAGYDEIERIAAGMATGSKETD